MVARGKELVLIIYIPIRQALYNRRSDYQNSIGLRFFSPQPSPAFTFVGALFFTSVFDFISRSKDRGI